MKHNAQLFAGLTLVCGTLAWAASGTQVDQPYCKATLLAEFDTVRPGAAFTLGLLLEPSEHWHTYWRNPGDAGMATSIDWTLPQGFEASDIHWPVPQRFEAAGSIVTYGYEGSILLMTTIQPPDSLEADVVAITADARWLVCDADTCLPGKAQLTLTLPVTQGEPVPDTKVAVLFDTARAKLPRPLAEDRVRAMLSQDTDEIVLTIKDMQVDLSTVQFLSADSQIEAHTMQVYDGQLWIHFSQTQPNLAAPKRIRGILKTNDQAYRIDIPVEINESP